MLLKSSEHRDYQDDLMKPGWVGQDDHDMTFCPRPLLNEQTDVLTVDKGPGSEPPTLLSTASTRSSN